MALTRPVTAIVLVSLLSIFMLDACRSSQKEIVSANTILPDPAPSTPLAHWTATPTRIPVTRSVSGANLRGWTFLAQPQSTQRLRVLFFNGNAMTIDDSQSLYRDIAVRGADVTVFDYRGYGFSTGKPDVMDFRRDALAIYDHLASTGPVVVYGFSMGTAMATCVASRRKVAGLILAGAIATADEEFPIFGRAQGFSATKIANMVPSPEAIEAFNEKNLITKSSAPLLMLHGESDQLVPIQQGREVFAASPAQSKTFKSLPDTTHNETAQSPAALVAVRVFLSSLITPNLTPTQ